MIPLTSAASGAPVREPRTDFFSLFIYTYIFCSYCRVPRARPSFSSPAATTRPSVSKRTACGPDSADDSSGLSSLSIPITDIAGKESLRSSKDSREFSAFSGSDPLAAQPSIEIVISYTFKSFVGGFEDRHRDGGHASGSGPEVHQVSPLRRQLFVRGQWKI